MKLLRQLLIISLFCFSGEFIQALTGLPIPANVTGMVLLFLALCTGIVKLEAISEISRFLLDHLAFFFVPAGVGLAAYLGLLQDSWSAILIISFVVMAIVIAATGYTVQLLKRKAGKGGLEDE